MTHPHSRRYYLQDIPLDEATARYTDALAKVGALAPSEPERIPIQDALGNEPMSQFVAHVENMGVVNRKTNPHDGELNERRTPAIQNQPGKPKV